MSKQLSRLSEAWPCETRQPEVRGRASSGDKMVGVDSLSQLPPELVSMMSLRPDKIWKKIRFVYFCQASHFQKWDVKKLCLDESLLGIFVETTRLVSRSVRLLLSNIVL